MFERDTGLITDSFLQARIMLYRPGLGLIVARKQPAQSAQAMLDSTLLYAATACITTSQDMIHLCRRQAYGLSESQMLTPWWMNVLCKSCVELARSID